MPHLNEPHATWIGRMLTDASGHRIGRIDDVYIDDDTGLPEWLAVTAGLMGPITHFVPVRVANLSADGVQVPFPKDRVKVAPIAGADGRLSRMEKGRLYAHYGYTYAEERNRLQRSLGFDPPAPSGPPDGRDERPAVDLRDVSAPAGMLALCPPADARREAAPDACRVASPEARTVAAPLPPPSRAEDRGRWPDDDAIFALSQAAPPLATSGRPRRR